MKHRELYFQLKDAIKADNVCTETILPILGYVAKENPIRHQEFVRWLGKVKQDLAEASMDDAQLTIEFNN